jgi:hypothetical protein
MEECTSPARGERLAARARVALALGIGACVVLGAAAAAERVAPLEEWVLSLPILLAGATAILAIVLGYSANARFRWELGYPERVNRAAVAVLVGYAWWGIGFLFLAPGPKEDRALVVVLVVAFIELPRAVISRSTHAAVRIAAVFTLALLSGLLYWILRVPHLGIVGTVELAFLSGWILFHDIPKHRGLVLVCLYTVTIATLVWGWYVF